jgi:large subunit ribosomal protein L5
MNPMREIRIEKVTLNMGVGGDQGKLEKSMKLLEAITGAKPVKTSSKKRIPGWGVRPGLAIACKVNIRGEKAQIVLKKLFEALDFKISPRRFDNVGNFGFGIHEYINIEGVPYDPELGIVGLEVAVTLERPGYRVKKRALRPAKVGKTHKITKEEAIEFVKEKFKVEVEE